MGWVIQIDNAGGVVPEITLAMAYNFEGNRLWLSYSRGGRVKYAWLNQRLLAMTMTTADLKSARVYFA